jgi:hypothetical protein
MLVLPDRVGEALEKLCLASALARGITRAKPLSVPGSIAAEMYANVKRLSHSPGGRSPRRQTWHLLRFWPMRVSSWKKRRMRLFC